MPAFAKRHYETTAKAVKAAAGHEPGVPGVRHQAGHDAGPPAERAGPGQPEDLAHAREAGRVVAQQCLLEAVPCGEGGSDFGGKDGGVLQSLTRALADGRQHGVRGVAGQHDVAAMQRTGRPQILGAPLDPLLRLGGPRELTEHEVLVLTCLFPLGFRRTSR